MSAPITEAHRKLRETLEIRWMRATELEIEQLIADSEAAAVQITMLREYGNLCATNESLAKERDQLRADRDYNHECINRLASATATFGEKSEKVVEVALSTIDQLRAEVKQLTAQVALDDRAKGTMLKVFHNEQARAERAEAEVHQVACARTDGILRESDLQCRLNMERARLRDLWCEMALEYRDERISYVSVQITRSVWDELDAAMKEGAK